MSDKRLLVLMILDGWGMKQGGENDALTQADLPNFDRLWQQYPHTCLEASGTGVGLPQGQMGNSEVGHTNIGAGRVVYQDFTRIGMAIKDGSFYTNPAFIAACDHVKQTGGALHLMGLVSDGGVHSHIDHLIALLQMAAQQGISDVFIHCFCDGRDTGIDLAAGYMEQIEEASDKLGVGKIASVMGRFYAMDRDKRWKRVVKAYDVMVHGKGYQAASATEAIKHSYDQGKYDEFIEPSVIVDEDGQPLGLIKSGDSIIFFNFRSDRTREISHALVDDDFDKFDRGDDPPQVFLTTMTLYEDSLSDAAIAFSPNIPKQTLAQIISAHGLRQLRLAETEKYAHVTFFFNGGVEAIEEGEDRILIPSPKVKTYDLQPQMSAELVADTLIEKINSDLYDLIVINFANPDMVGHTGVREAIIQAVEFVDICLGRVAQVIEEKGATWIITADHGNAEQMMEDGAVMTAHTTNLVPLILVSPDAANYQLNKGRLEDIAPTVLDLLGIDQPKEMTGSSLIKKQSE